MRFHGSDFLGRTLKVEPIRDHPKMGRVKVPERMVSYVVGAVKKVPKISSSSGGSSSSSSSKLKSLRSISRLEKNTPSQQENNEISAKELRKRKQQEEKQKLKAELEFPMNPLQQDELLRAARRGYLTLEGRGHIRGRKLNTLACAHRQFCDEREKPQIILCKSVGVGSKLSPLDCLIVDLSPLRLTKAVGDDLVNDFLVHWKTQILTAAANSGMKLRRDYQEDNCDNLSLLNDEAETKVECTFVDMDQGITDQIANAEAASFLEYTITLTEEDCWTTEPISRLPVMSLGVFEGERSSAKAMAKELADLWHLPIEPLDQATEDTPCVDQKRADGKKQRGSKARRHRRNENKRRRQINQRDLNTFFR